MTKRQTRSLVLALAAITVALALATDAEAQGVTYYYGGPIWYSGSVHYHGVYQSTSWHWAHWLGWHTHDHYVYVPHWGPGHYVYRQLRDVPVATASSY